MQLTTNKKTSWRNQKISFLLALSWEIFETRQLKFLTSSPRALIWLIRFKADSLLNRLFATSNRFHILEFMSANNCNDKFVSVG